MSEPSKPMTAPHVTPRAPLPPGLRARILADAAARPASTGGTTRLLALVVAGMLWVALRASLEGVREDWTALPASATWLPLVDAVATAMLVTALSLSRGRSMVGPSARALWSAALAPALISLTVILLAVRSEATEAAALAAFGGRYWAAITTCETEAMVVGVPVTLLLVAAQRRLVFASPALLGAAAGIAAGSWSHAILHRACPMGSDAGHVLLGHAAPTLPLAALGALAAWALDRRSLRNR
jgi:hypothetical protein